MFKILSKQNCGVALTLLLTILLSQTNIMNLFFDTILGRIGLLIIIFGISYTNHLLGIASTFFVIMLFACCYHYSENFETVDTTTSTPLSESTPLSDTTPLSESTTPLSDDSDNNKYMVTEGFDILGTERTLQRGKKSNTIMVNEDMRKSENPTPYDGWLNQSYFTSII
jgi:hypothetical protein